MKNFQNSVDVLLYIDFNFVKKVIPVGFIVQEIYYDYNI